MTRVEKREAIDGLATKIAASPFFYLADASSLNVETINKFRRLCFQRGVEFRVVKNTLLRKAMEQVGEGYQELFPTLKGATSILIAEQEISLPVCSKSSGRSPTSRCSRPPTLIQPFILVITSWML